MDSPNVKPDRSPRARGCTVNLNEIVDLGDHLRAPLSEVIAAANPDCRYCSGGLQRYRYMGRTKIRLCGCGVRGMRRKLLGDEPIRPFGTVTRDAALERERVEKKIALLREEISKAEAKAAEIMRAPSAAVQTVGTQRSALVGKLTEQDSTVARWRAQRDAEIHGLRVTVANLRAAREEREQLLRRYTASTEELNRAFRAYEAAERGAAKITRRLSRLQAQIAALQIRHSEVLGAPINCTLKIDTTEETR